MKIPALKFRFPQLAAGGLVVMVVVLGFSFLATVLIPGLELAGELVDSSVALKFVSQQQRYPTLIHSALDSMHDRLMARAYLQESMDQLRDSAKKLDVALPAMNAPRPANWLAYTGDSGPARRGA